MRDIADIVLWLLQWLLVAFGILTIVLAISTYTTEVQYFSSIPAAEPGIDSYTPPFLHRLVTGTTTGLVAAGLGAVLFYLRKLYLLRR
mgnify:CR=1 FL=1